MSRFKVSLVAFCWLVLSGVVQAGYHEHRLGPAYEIHTPLGFSQAEIERCLDSVATPPDYSDPSRDLPLTGLCGENDGHLYHTSVNAILAPLRPAMIHLDRLPTRNQMVLGGRCLIHDYCYDEHDLHSDRGLTSAVVADCLEGTTRAQIQDAYREYFTAAESRDVVTYFAEALPGASLSALDRYEWAIDVSAEECLSQYGSAGLAWEGCIVNFPLPRQSYSHWVYDNGDVLEDVLVDGRTYRVHLFGHEDEPSSGHTVRYTATVDTSSDPSRSIARHDAEARAALRQFFSRHRQISVKFLR